MMVLTGPKASTLCASSPTKGFSFNNNKIVTTYGGGALVTESEEIYSKALFWANQSRENKTFYEHSDIGFNYRMGPLNAAAGLVGMKDVYQKVKDRRQIFERYHDAFEKCELEVQWLVERPGYYSNRWLSTGVLNTLKVNEITSKMLNMGIECRRLWNPMHLQPYFKKYPSYVSGLAEKLFRDGLCLPCCRREEVALVAEAIISASKGYLS